MSEQADKPKHKRRWLRFSLKSFLVVLTVFCVWLGALVYRVNQQREVVQWVRDMGDTIRYDFERSGGQLLVSFVDHIAAHRETTRRASPQWASRRNQAPAPRGLYFVLISIATTPPIVQ